MKDLLRRLPAPALDVIRAVYLRLLSAREHFYAWADSHGILGPNQYYDDRYFERRLEDPWRADDREIARAIEILFQPDSIIDYGCAVGTLLEYFEEDGREVFGVEGNATAVDKAVISRESIAEADLRYGFEPSREFDVVSCIEVAEHIPERFDDELIDTLCRSGPVIVFTAARPGQAGTHHVNCKDREYWIRKFNERGYSLDSPTTNQFKEEVDIDHKEWVPENIFIFRETPRGL